MGRPRRHLQPPQTQLPEIERLRLVLRALIAMASLSRKEVQRRIAGNGYPGAQGRVPAAPKLSKWPSKK